MTNTEPKMQVLELEPHDVKQLISVIRTQQATCVYSLAWHLFPHHNEAGERSGVLPGSKRAVATTLQQLIREGTLTPQEIASSFDAACARKGVPNDTASDVRKYGLN